MSKIDNYITKHSSTNPEFAEALQQESINMEIAVKVQDLRTRKGLSQRELASLLGKPQSTIARIENGSVNASTKMLADIADATHSKLAIEFTTP